MHVPPTGPQLETVRDAQVVSWQHPSGHDTASHWQSPLRHLCPPAHSDVPPQLHAPEVEQLSDRVASQALHTPPTGPQVAAATGSHVLPEQHPVVHVAAQPAQTP